MKLAGSLLYFSAIALFAIGNAENHPAHADTFGSGATAFDIEFVRIGNPGNEADTSGTPSRAGRVDYVYRIGKFEISAQMIDKANAEGKLTIVKDFRSPDKPATSVSWYEAARFVNWLNVSSGSPPAYKFIFQPGEAGYYENQANLLWTIDDAGYDPNNPVRSRLARYFLPSVDEWYKAAYYDPGANGGAGGYWDFPTGSDTAPLAVTSGTAPNTAVFGGKPGPVDVTLAGGLSPYGTMGQGGNVHEWDETDIDLVNDPNSTYGATRGGSWLDPYYFLLSSSRPQLCQACGHREVGFRVASMPSIPEPNTLLLGMILGLSTRLCRRARSVGSLS